MLDALEIFKEIEAFDAQTNNINGRLDMLGHQKICYTKLAESEANLDKKRELQKQAKETSEKALIFAGEHSEVGEGRIATQEIHYTSACFDYGCGLEDGKQKQQVLEEGLETINKAIEKLPGSKAHRAWPMNSKAKILFHLGRMSEAIQTLLLGQEYIYDGYIDEINSKDGQGEIKINVWLSGLHATLADICAKTNRPILAKHYASMVIAIPDPTNVLTLRKKEAQEILDAIN